MECIPINEHAQKSIIDGGKIEENRGVGQMLLGPGDALSIGWKSYVLELQTKRLLLANLSNLSQSLLKGHQA